MSTGVSHSSQIAHETIMAGGKVAPARHHAAMRTSSRSAGAASKPLVTLVAVMLAAAACSPLALSSPGAVPVSSTPSSIAPRITAGPVGPSPSPSPSSVADGSDDLRLPPANAGFDYQLGGAYPPPPASRSSRATGPRHPRPGCYNICYVNGFQVQPGEDAWWRANHPDLLLRDKNGKVVIDRDWNEIMLAPTTAKRDGARRGHR